MTDVELITKAFNFAAQKHSKQRRKGVDAEPYINHLTEVAELLAASGADAITIAAGILHDTIEDTNTTRQELAHEFGQNIADIVAECSDDKSLPKAERKRLQVIHAAHASNSAKQVKLADKISNFHSILESPPADWIEARKLEYFHWGKSVVDNCRGANPALEEKFDALYARGIREFSPR